VKTAVSIPDALLKMTRSALFGGVLREYVARHTDGDVTDATNAALPESGDRSDPFNREASVRVPERTEW